MAHKTLRLVTSCYQLVGISILFWGTVAHAWPESGESNVFDLTPPFPVRELTGESNVFSLRHAGQRESTVIAWGANGAGQCSVPPGLADVVSISAGGWHSLALRTNGEVVSWGSNASGQCDVPPGMGSVRKIAAGRRHSVALTEGGEVKAWGANSDGQCDVPEGLTEVVEIAAGWHSLALREDGTVAAWGPEGDWCDVPGGLTNVAAIAAGVAHSIALRQNGEVVAWGDNSFGQCDVPQNLGEVTAIAAGDAHSVALKADRTVAVWGSNELGQCDVPTALEDVIGIAAGNDHTMALKTDGSVVTWGTNVEGQTAAPASLADARAIDAGRGHSMALVRAPTKAVEYVQIFQVPGRKLVEVEYKVAAGQPDDLQIAISGRDGAGGEAFNITSLTGDGASGEGVGPGVHFLTWDAQLDLPGRLIEAFSVEVAAGGNSTYSNAIRLDTRQAFAVTAVTSPYSSNNRPAVFLDGVSFEVTFTVEVDWDGRTPGKLSFVTPGGTFTQSASNPNRTFNMGADFGPGGRLEVKAVDGEGYETAPADANIEVASCPPVLTSAFLTVEASADTFRYRLPNLGGVRMTIHDEDAKSIPDDIPLFGGHKMGFDYLNLDMAVQVNGDGAAEFSGGGGVENPAVLNLGGMDLETILRAGVGWVYDTEQDEWVLDTGFVDAEMSGEVEIGPYYMIVAAGPVPIPVYLRGEFGGGLESRLAVTGFANDEWIYEGRLEPSIYGKAAVGAGVASVLCIEGYFGAKGGVLLVFPEEPTLSDTYVTLSGGISVTALLWQWENDFLEYTWSMDDAPQRGPIGLPDFRGEAGQLIPRGYLGERVDNGEKRAGGFSAEEISASRSASPGSTELVLQEHAFPYSQPVLQRVGDEVVLLWIADEPTRSSANRTALHSRVYSNGTWSPAASASPDGTGDFNPVFSANDTGGWCAWQDMGSEVADDVELSEMLSVSEISVSAYDADNRHWDSTYSLTDNDMADHKPHVACSGDSALVVWVRNQGNDLLGSIEKPNTLMAAVRNADTGWSQPQVVVDNVGTLVDAALTFNGTTGTYIYVVDGDGDIGTDVDKELYRVDYAVDTGWSAALRMTNDESLDANPQFVTDKDGGVFLFWYRDSEIRMARGANLEDQSSVVSTSGAQGCRDFRVCVSPFGQVAVVYAASSGSGGQDLFAAVFDADRESWGGPLRLTGDTAMERSLDASYLADGTLMAVYNKVPICDAVRTVQVGEENRTVTVPEPDIGNVSLCTLTRVVAGDLVARKPVVFPTNPHPGTEVEIAASVVNDGDLAAQDIAVEFYDGDPEYGGTMIGSRQVLEGVLSAGSSSTVSITWTVPGDSVKPRDLFVVVDPENEYNERNTGNNRAWTEIMAADLTVESAYTEALGEESYSVHALVANRGTIPLSDFTVAVCGDASPPNILGEREVMLAAGEECGVTIPVNWQAAGEEPVFIVCADPRDYIAEANEENNRATTRVQRLSTPPPTLSPSSGVYADAQMVSIDVPTGSTVHLTMDGSEPTVSSNEYTEAFAVNAATEVRAKAFKDGLRPSSTVRAVYTFEGENRAPSMESLEADAVQGQPLSCRLLCTASDPDHGPGDLVYTWSVQSPADAPINFGESNGTSQGTGVIAEFPSEGNYQIGLVVSDGASDVDAELRVELPLDKDIDELPDWWEKQIVNADTTDDLVEVVDILGEDNFDGDAAVNAEEYRRGTNPTIIDAFSVVFDLGELGHRTGGGNLEQIVHANAGAIPPILDAQEGWWFTGWDTDFKNVTHDLTVTAEYAEKGESILAHRGVNLCGAEFGQHNLPGEYGTDYIYPDTDTIRYFLAKGMTSIRLPFRWERLQRTLEGELDADELARMHATVDTITHAGGMVILDPHAHDPTGYDGQALGTGEVTVAVFADLWSRLATEFAGNERVAFGLINEPHDIQATTWLSAANAAIAAIRDAGADNLILVPGINWTSSFSWYDDHGYGSNAETMTGIVDHQDNFAVEVHLYFDADNSGTTSDVVSPTIGRERLADFVFWCRTHNMRGFLGEVGAPATDAGDAVLDDTLNYIETEADDVFLGWTYWAAGQWWPADERFSIQPTDPTDFDQEDQQLTVMSPYLPSVHRVEFSAGPHGSLADAALAWQVVPEGQDAEAPHIEPNEGWWFLGWGQESANITGDRTIHAVVEAWTDADLDGIHDTEEALLADATGSADVNPVGDLDGDGYSNLAEISERTDPLDDQDSPAGFEICLCPEWNLVSVGIRPIDPTMETLFQNKVSRAVWGWENGVYMSRDEATPCGGMWVEYEGITPTYVLVQGESDGLPDIDLDAGWNLLGVPSKVIAAELLDGADFIGTVWYWNALTQQYDKLPVSEPMLPGYAYWVFLKQPFTISMGN